MWEFLAARERYIDDYLEACLHEGHCVRGRPTALSQKALEDRTLQAELPGYWKYAQEVRYRLIPSVLREMASAAATR